MTFDLEDFINRDYLGVFGLILGLLAKFDVRAVFFITGHMAEKLTSFPSILRQLESHEIGFHSSAHSVRPTIFEYCDVKNYEDAFQASLERETSHINPLSGDVQGKGGIHALIDLFPSKKILAYRAPGYCCPPPHLEAMASLGIRYDFSWSISKAPVDYKGITFYPRPIFLDGERALLGGGPRIMNWARLMQSICMEEMTILNFHPHCFVEKDYWDSIYHRGNPTELTKAMSRDNTETQHMFTKLEGLLKRVHHLEELGVIETSPDLKRTRTNLDATRLDIDKLAKAFSFWPETFFGYKPRYIRPQLSKFFELYS